MPATSCASTSSPTSGNGGHAGAQTFISTLLREAGYRRCLILDGNVRDLFADLREPSILPSAERMLIVFEPLPEIVWPPMGSTAWRVVPLCAWPFDNCTGTAME